MPKLYRETDNGNFEELTNKEVRDHLDSMEDYAFWLTHGSENFSLCNSFASLLVHGQTEYQLFLTSEEGFTKQEPTDKFWGYLCVILNDLYAINNMTDSEMTRRVARMLPDAGSWKQLELRDVPQYEKKAIHKLEVFMINATLSGERWEEYPRLRRLFRQAARETEQKVPHYLREEYYE